MATRTGFFHSNILDENDTYYPLLSLGTTGMNKTGVNAEIKYENKTLTIGNVNTTTINGEDPSYLKNNGLFPQITIPLPSFYLVSDFTAIVDTLLINNQSPSFLEYIASSTDKRYDLVEVDDSDKMSQTWYENNIRCALVMTGFSDLLSTRLLFTDKYQHLYTQMILANVLTLALPKFTIKRISDADWTKVGSWSPHSYLPFEYGLTSSSPYLNSYIEKNVGTTRYIAVRVGTNTASAVPYNWEIYVNNLLVGKIQGTTPIENPAFYSLQSFAVIIDLGGNLNNCVIKIVNKRTDTLNGRASYIDYVAYYTDDDLVDGGDLISGRQVLITSVPRFTDNGSEKKRRLLNDARKAVATTCRLMGLPVSYYDLSEGSTLMSGQTPILTSTQHKSLANELLQEVLNVEIVPPPTSAPIPRP